MLVSFICSIVTLYVPGVVFIDTVMFACISVEFTIMYESTVMFPFVKFIVALELKSVPVMFTSLVAACEKFDGSIPVMPSAAGSNICSPVGPAVNICCFGVSVLIPIYTAIRSVIMTVMM